MGPAAPRNSLAMYGETAAPVVRATPVTPDAAERSSGSTTAIVYAWRVGTSIWEMLKRARRRTMARASLGINGTRISRMLEGMWVKTMVFNKPMRAASQEAERADMP